MEDFAPNKYSRQPVCLPNFASCDTVETHAVHKRSVSSPSPLVARAFLIPPADNTQIYSFSRSETRERFGFRPKFVLQRNQSSLTHFPTLRILNRAIKGKYWRDWRAQENTRVRQCVGHPCNYYRDVLRRQCSDTNRNIKRLVYCRYGKQSLTFQVQALYQRETSSMLLSDEGPTREFDYEYTTSLVIFGTNNHK